MRWLSALLVVGLVAAVGFGWWTDDPAPPVPAAAADATAAPGAAEAVVDLGWDLAPEAATSESTGFDPEADERVAADDLEGPATSRSVLVVRGDPPVPVADAEVLHCDELTILERLRGVREPPREQWPDRWGQRSRTAEDGTAPLPDGNTLLVAARDGGDFAFARVRPGRRQTTLTLVPDERVTLRAVHEDGAPVAAVPLAIVQWLGKGEPERIWSGESGPDGTAVVEHFQLHRRKPADGERFAALALVPGPQPTAAEFAGRPATAEPVVLLLPALGAIELTLTDHAGTPLLSPALVGARDAVRPETPLSFAVAAGLLSRSAPKPPGDGAVRLWPVAAGAEFTVTAHFQNDRKGIATVVRGPARDGETVRTTLALGPGQVVAAGRCLGDDGQPLAPAMLSCSLWHGDRDLAPVNLHTVAGGHFDVVVARRDEPAPFVLHVRHRSDGPDGPRELGARVPLPALAGGRRIELGDVLLHELPPLASGRVLDDRGEAVPGAQIAVQAHRPERRRGPWPTLQGLSVRSGDDGTFVVRGELPPPGELRLHVHTERHFAATAPLEVQGQQFDVRLERFAVVRGRVRLPDWLPEQAARLALQPIDEAQRSERTRTVDLRRRRGGRFAVQPLRAGRYDALFTVRNVAEPVLVVRDVFVQPGENADPRLAEVDLRTALFRYRLRAVDAAGRTVAFDGPIHARLAMPDGAFVEAGFRWQRGQAELITPGTQAELLFFGRGFLPQRLVLGPGEHDVHLVPLRPALLELPGARALCGPTRRVRVSVILTGRTGYPESLSGVDQRSGRSFSFPRWDLGKSGGAWLERYDTVEVPLMRSGTYEVVLRVHATETERSPQASVSLGTYELEVDSASLIPVRVRVDAAAIERACAEVDERQRTALAQRQQPR